MGSGLLMCAPLATFSISFSKGKHSFMFPPSFAHYTFWLPFFLQQLSSLSNSSVTFCKEKQTHADVKWWHLLGYLWTSGVSRVFVEHHPKTVQQNRVTNLLPCGLKQGNPYSPTTPLLVSPLVCPLGSSHEVWHHCQVSPQDPAE